ncbi:MAG: hypothetical protein IJG45_07955 [Oscillospiraceae bacterium]|nr:hypothetical protein [Oscillospiraceae bacterium]
MNIRKAAAVASTGTPDAQQLKKINLYSKAALTAEQVYCFSVRLCDDQPDRDFERFDTDALPVLAELFRGKTGIVDHDWSAERQIARIFDTEVLCENGAHYIRAWCYLLRTEKNADFIAQIEGGIKKEVSVGCAVQRTVCSVCGKPYGSCEHRKGLTYDGQLCLAVLCDPADAYEFSFVAVPAQREAGVMKKAEGGVCMTLQELVSKSGTPDLCDSLNALEREAQFGRDCRNAMLRETVSLGLLLDFGADEAILRKAFSALESAELSALKDAMAQKAAALFPPSAQLPANKNARGAMDAAYII